LGRASHTPLRCYVGVTAGMPFQLLLMEKLYYVDQKSSYRQRSAGLMYSGNLAKSASLTSVQYSNQSSTMANGESLNAGTGTSGRERRKQLSISEFNGKKAGLV
jgi:hypothetical protein